jgi:hypothetical protein
MPPQLPAAAAAFTWSADTGVPATIVYFCTSCLKKIRRIIVMRYLYSRRSIGVQISHDNNSSQRFFKQKAGFRECYFAVRVMITTVSSFQTGFPHFRMHMYIRAYVILLILLSPKSLICLHLAILFANLCRRCLAFFASLLSVATASAAALARRTGCKNAPYWLDIVGRLPVCAPACLPACLPP